LAPKDLEDFELDVGGVGAGGAGHFVPCGPEEASARTASHPNRRMAQCAGGALPQPTGVGANSNELELVGSMEFWRIFF
jgi:hypothetical protein